MLTRRTFVGVAGVLAWCAAFLRPLPTVSGSTRPLDHDEVFWGPRGGTLYMSRDATKGAVLQPGYEMKSRKGRFMRAREAYIERVNKPLNLRTLMALAVKKSR